MSKYGYVGKHSDIPQQAFKANAGVLSVNDHLALSQENKLTQYGQLELIETQEITSSTGTMDFTNIKETEYNVHFLAYSNFQGTVDGNNFQVRLFENGTVESGSVYEYQHYYIQADGSAAQQRSTSLSYIRGSIGNGNDTNEIGNGYMYFFNLGNISAYSFTSQSYVGQNQNSLVQTTMGITMLPQQSRVDGIRIFTNDSIDTLKASLYGIRSY